MFTTIRWQVLTAGTTASKKASWAKAGGGDHYQIGPFYRSSSIGPDVVEPGEACAPRLGVTRQFNAAQLCYLLDAPGVRRCFVEGDPMFH